MVDEANPPDTEVAPREALAPTNDACRTEGLDALPTSGDDLPGCAATPPGRETGCLPEDEMVGIDGCNEVAGDEVVLLERSVRAASQSTWQRTTQKVSCLGSRSAHSTCNGQQRRLQ